MYALLHPFSADGADPGQAGDVRRRRQHHQHHLRRRERPGQRPVDAQGEGAQSDKLGLQRSCKQVFDNPRLPQYTGRTVRHKFANPVLQLILLICIGISAQWDPTVELWPLF